MAKDRRGKKWTTRENEKLLRLIDDGKTFAEAAKALGRTVRACKTQYICISRGKDVYVAELQSKPYFSACWLCKKACIDCKKPVKGWKATKVVNCHSEAYIVKQCPEYEPEPWVDKYDCSEFYQNPKKAVKNGKTSRFET